MKILTVQLGVDDERGRIFQALLNLKRHPFTRGSVTRQLLKKPAMTVYMVAGIYWQAFETL